MISSLDETIRRLLIDRGGLDPTEIDIRFEIPDRDWAASISRPTINCYLFDIHENRQLRAAGQWLERDSRTARVRKPPWRINLSYLVTAWTKAVEDEHRLLWQVLTTLARYAELPREILQGALATVEIEIPTSVAQPDGGPLRSPGEFWSALENKLKPSVNYIITVPMDVDGLPPVPFVLTPLQIRSTQIGGPPGGNGTGGAIGPGGMLPGAGPSGGTGGGPGAGGNGQGGGTTPGDGSGSGASPSDGTAGTGGRSRRGGTRQGATVATTANSAASVEAVTAGTAGGDTASGHGTTTVREAGGFTISGAVRDAGGAIIKTARVFFLGSGSAANVASFRSGSHYGGQSRRPEGVGYGRGDGTDQSVITTCEGAFTLFTVPAGTHWVGVQLPGHPLRRHELTVPAQTYDLVLDDVPSAAP